ncbi:hypothetical protein ABH931_005501 [Streptacidiphilus sp. MAP12-33]|uniref:hypothetical protein n=1 Tax=Streptacidiphilus sp. MAP12-33 TaxID=3156266 RepID=UPI0035137191
MGIRPTFAPGSNQPYVITQTPPPAPLPVPVQQPTAPAPANYQQQPATYYAPPAPVIVRAARPSVAPYVAGGIGAVVAVIVAGAIAIGILLALAVASVAVKGLVNSLKEHGPTRD